MSVLLQSMVTSKYVEQPAVWTERPERAREFNGGTEALLYCYQQQLRNMQILGRFEDPRKDFTIPLSDNRVE